MQEEDEGEEDEGEEDEDEEDEDEEDEGEEDEGEEDEGEEDEGEELAGEHTQGDDALAEHVDTIAKLWDRWNPDDKVHRVLKTAIDNTEHAMRSGQRFEN